MNIGWFGLGKLGMPCAEVIADKGHKVYGYDVADVTSNKVTVVDHPSKAVHDMDFVFVAVQTPHDPLYGGEQPITHLPNKDFGLDSVKEVLSTIDAYSNADTIIVLISTVLPGTTRREFANRIRKGRLIYNPYLIAMGTVEWDMVNPDMVIVGGEKPNDSDAKKLIKFYKTIMENDPRYEIGTWDECECIKVFYNTFISAKIGLVNMIQDVAEKQGHINVDVETNALAKSDQRIMGPSYMKAGMGDGGACHPRDNIALRYMAQNLGLQYDIFDAIMNAREVQAKNMANYLIKIAEERSLPILLNGIAYKPGVPYTDGSYSLLVGHYCKEAGYHCIEVDPMASPQKGPFTAVALLAHPTLYCYLSEGSVVVDPWREFESKKLEVFHYGNTR